MKRRNFILTPVLFAIGDCFADTRNRIDHYPKLLSTDTQQLLRILNNPQSAAELGRQYLSDKPALANEQMLKQALGVNGEKDYASAKQLFEAQQILDFEKGNVQCIDGWILSNAEASLCALAAMATSRS